MFQVLYRKYRPANFSEVRGQDHVIKTLKGAILANRVAHAYLFSGPRGTGKTSVARLLAKALNCKNAKTYEPCNKCDSCNSINQSRSLDIIEIDGASNRGIDEIRNIKDIARVAASQHRYKIFIIDEVHSLTKEAFNALLKMLEEPPQHVKFILATTEPHKILPTVLSRVQRLDFNRIPSGDIVKKLKSISVKEGIRVEEEVLKTLAINSEGSLRDAESNFARLISLAGENITLEKTKSVLGFVPFNIFCKFAGYILASQEKDGVNLVNQMYESGINLEKFTDDFLKFVRKIIVVKMNQDLPEEWAEEMTTEQINAIKSLAADNEIGIFTNLMEIFMKAKTKFAISPIPQLPLELAILEFTNNKF